MLFLLGRAAATFCCSFSCAEQLAPNVTASPLWMASDTSSSDSSSEEVLLDGSPLCSWLGGVSVTYRVGDLEEVREWLLVPERLRLLERLELPDLLRVLERLWLPDLLRVLERPRLLVRRKESA